MTAPFRGFKCPCKYIYIKYIICVCICNNNNIYIYKDSRGFLFSAALQDRICQKLKRNTTDKKHLPPRESIFWTPVQYTPRKTRPNPRLTLPRHIRATPVSGHTQRQQGTSTLYETTPCFFFALFQRPLICEGNFVSSSFGKGFVRPVRNWFLRFLVKEFHGKRNSARIASPLLM